MTREELVENLDRARTARDVELAEVAEKHRAIIDEAENAVVEFDNNSNVEEVVEAVIEGEAPAEPVADVEENVVGIAVSGEVVAEDDDNSPTAEEEEILRRAAEIEAKYQK